MATFYQAALGQNQIGLNPNKKVIDEFIKDGQGRMWVKWTGKKRFVLLDPEMALWAVYATASR